LRRVKKESENFNHEKIITTWRLKKSVKAKNGKEKRDT